MPIAKLFIEGNLESELLTPILQGTPVLQQGGSKNSLRPRAWTDRVENAVAAGYLRDRDFDFDPPDDLSTPTIDGDIAGVPFGWRWCRHEIENYLIDPLIVSEAMAWPLVEIDEALRQAALTIRNYEAARWTIGVVRRSLPPHYELNTRPDGLADIGLPPALDSPTVNTWASQRILGHRRGILEVTDPVAIQTSFDRFVTRFDDVFLSDSQNILLWLPGKDLLAAMGEWLATKGIANPGLFRALLRDWIISNPLRSLDLLAEWDALVNVLRA